MNQAELALPPRVPEGKTDHWFTPMERWAPWHRAHRFTLDVAGHPDAPVSQAIGRYFSIRNDGLAQSWSGESVWLNPPFSDITPWIEKAAFEVKQDCHRVVALVPANRTEQPWWQEFVEPYRDKERHRLSHRYSLKTTFLPKRFKFGFPGDPQGKASAQPTFGCVLLEWMRR